MNSIEVKAYECDKCHKTYLDKSFADRCCEYKEQKKCKDCGCELPKEYISLCKFCQSKREFNNGVVLTMDEFLKSEYKDNMVVHNDRYYVDIDDFIESIEEDDLRNIEYIKATDKYTHELDADNLIENLEVDTNCEDDLYVDKQGVKELYDFLKVWNEKYHLTTYEEINVYIKIDDYLKGVLK